LAAQSLNAKPLAIAPLTANALTAKSLALDALASDSLQQSLEIGGLVSCTLPHARLDLEQFHQKLQLGLLSAQLVCAELVCAELVRTELIAGALISAELARAKLARSELARTKRTGSERQTAGYLAAKLLAGSVAGSRIVVGHCSAAAGRRPTRVVTGPAMMPAAMVCLSRGVAVQPGEDYTSEQAAHNLRCRYLKPHANLRTCVRM
jgi:hypothetical protein